MFVEVLVDVKHQAVDQMYDYRVPETLHSLIELGQRVKIPFGHRQISGIVVGIKDQTTLKSVKAIIAILDIEPLYTKELIDLAFQLADEHLGITLSYLQAMIPAALKMRYKKYLTTKHPESLPKSLKEQFKDKKAIPVEKVDLNYSKLRELIENGHLTMETKFSQKLGIYQEQYVYLKTLKEVKGNKQKAIIEALKAQDGQRKQTLLKRTDSSHTTLNSLIKQNIVNIETKEAHRVIKSLYKLPKQTINLNPDQTLAYEAIRQAQNTYHPFLLHGITSSGKTEVYIKLVDDCLKNQQSALILVPEISLTPNLAARFKAKFNDQVLLYHSRLSEGERYDEWRKAKQSKPYVMIGARSAIFTPLNNLGLIVIDEEHSDAYQQEDYPKYNAIDVAIKRAQYHQIPLVLGSATPRVESYYKALNEEYTLLELKHRALKSVLPKVELVDMRNELHQGNTSIFSMAALAAIEQALKRNEQVLVLINRRGHANFVLCRECGKTIRCQDCELSMTYHHKAKKLKCHYCHSDQPMPNICPHCGSKHIRYMGIGSEKVEQVLNSTFPKATVIRMDHDTTQQKNAHEKLLYAFEHEGDILVGTQMISKGLDFHNVRLVIILSADMALNIPDYYAHEEAFQLFMQMAGRSGRRSEQGHVVIQAYDTKHPILKHLINHDYQGFYQNEITKRKTLKLPPFARTIQLTIKHAYKNKAYLKATEVMRILNTMNKKQSRIIGPIIPKVAKVQNQYRTQIIIKSTHIDDWQNTLKTLHKKIDFKNYTISVDYRITL